MVAPWRIRHHWKQPERVQLVPNGMLLLSVSPIPLFLDTIPGIDPGPLDPGTFPGDEPGFDPDPMPDPDPDPLGPSTGVPGLDPGFPSPDYPSPNLPGSPLPA